MADINSKGERTREQVLQRAAELFNRRGYQATSIAEIMAATGLQKGGIYRHFASKDELALAAFEFAVTRMTERFTTALFGKQAALERLLALAHVYARIPRDPPVPGGCPLLNAAVEADDGYPALRQSAQRVLKGLERVIKRALSEGKQTGELRADLDVEVETQTLIALFEGSVMLAKLSGDSSTARAVNRGVVRYIEGLAR
jgi:AcrR family transcriptional regulator